MPSNSVPVILGPWTGGINTSSDPTAIDDTELWDCINLEVEIDGSLVSRPPLLVSPHGNGTWTDHINIIGSATISTNNYLVGSNSQGTYVFDGTSWSTLKAGLVSYSAVQIRDLIYVVPAPVSAQSGGYWSPGGGFTVDNAMPHGEKGVFLKDRLWVVPGFSATTHQSRLQFTEPIVANTLNWLSTNFIDIANGDGENLVDMAIFDDNLLLFKSASTYVYAFDLQPSDGSVQVVNPNIGVSAKHCVVYYENTIYVFFQGHVYGIVQYQFQRVTDKLLLEYDPFAPTTRAENIFMCLFGDRLILRFYNKIYVLCLRVGSWVRWESSAQDLHNFGPLMKMPNNGSIAGQDLYYGGSSLAGDTSLFVIRDGFDAVTQEDITCYIKTKIIDIAAFLSARYRLYIFPDPSHFKRLAWWGGDVYAQGLVTGRANPVGNTFLVKWADVTGVLWPTDNRYIWSDPFTLPFAPQTDIEDDSRAQRKFYKFKKTLRFREIFFELYLNFDGTTTTGPCKVFGVTAMINQKQTVGAAVN